MTDRDFRPPNRPAEFTGTMWVGADKSIRGVISDVFLVPIQFIATKDGSEYHLRGWRGDQPEFTRIPIIDDHRDNDGLPREPCVTCEGRLFWRASVMAGHPDTRAWNCATCAPADPAVWIDGCSLPVKGKK